ncbi:MAG: type I methionyl aminopeptidase [Deltaproteobacteria bacterium]|nr:type I methionyl aminopeptidase [Deltaproteobacteria bacterium]
MPLPVLRPRQIDAMRRAGAAAAATLARVGAALGPGMRGDEVDRIVREDTKARGGTCAQLGYRSGRGPAFPAAVCLSPNAVVCHGLPTAEVVLQDGDIVNVDVTTCLHGWHGDTSATFFIGDPSPAARALVALARRCRDLAVALAGPGVRLGALGAAIEAEARAAGCSVVGEYGGHGIGAQMHLPPFVPHTGPAHRGPLLREGVCFTVEPMINAGGPAVRLRADGWTVETADGRLSAQFEHTVLVTPHGAEVLTLHV